MEIEPTALDLFRSANHKTDLKLYDEAMDRVDKGLVLEPDSFWGFAIKARILQELGRVEEARLAYMHSLDLAYTKQQIADEYNEYLAYVYSRLGYACLSLAMANQSNEIWQQSINSFSKSLELAPQQADAWYAIGFVNQNLKRYSKAIESFEKSIDLDGNDADAHVNKIRCELRLFRLVSAVKSAIKARAIFDHTPIRRKLP